MADLFKGKIFKTLLKIIISLAALVFVFTKIEINSVLTLLGKTNILPLIAAIFAFVISKLIAAGRLNSFFKAVEIRLTEKQNIRLYLLGMFYNLFLPGGIGGDGYKIFFLNKKTGVKKGKIFWAVFTDRLNGVFALFILAVVLALFIDLRQVFITDYMLLFIIPVAALSFYLLVKKLSPYLIKIIPSATLLSFLVQGFQLICACLVFIALGGESLVKEYLFVFLISSIVAMLPLSIGGVGLRELTFLYGSMFLGLDQQLSIAMSLIFYLITAFVSFWGIYYSINTGKLNEGRED